VAASPQAAAGSQKQRYLIVTDQNDTTKVILTQANGVIGGSQ